MPFNRGYKYIDNGDSLYTTNIPTIYFECGDAIDEVIVQVSGINSDGFSIYEKAYTLEPGKSNSKTLSDIIDGYYTFEYYGRIDVGTTNPKSTEKSTFVVFNATAESWDTEDYVLKVDTNGPKFRVFNIIPKNGSKIAWTVTAQIEDPVRGVHEVSLLINDEEYELIRDRAYPEYPDTFVWEITGLTGITPKGQFQVKAVDCVGHNSMSRKSKDITNDPAFKQLLKKNIRQIFSIISFFILIMGTNYESKIY